MAYVYLVSVFVIATCGLVYELVAGALASYLLGDSVTQFSTVIGVYLFSMGIGSFFSKYIERNIIGVFIQVEILVGLVGGFSSSILFLSFEHVASFRIILYTLVAITGMLVGLEIPLVMRFLRSHFEFKDLVARVFTFDYVGALLASLLFPLLLVPYLGLIRTSLLFGILNVLTGLLTLYLFKNEVPWIRLLKIASIVALIALLLGFVYSEKILSFAESSNYQDKVIYSKTSRYQRIVLTHSQNDIRLFLNGNLQFSSRDEYRYHEALVHIGLAAIPNPKNVLILGGGDGLGLREVLKYPSIEKIYLVDLDKEVTELFSKHPILVSLNQNSLSSPKLKVFNEDAFLWMKETKEKFDFIIVDFPDPSNFSVGKLYTDSFYKLLNLSLNPKGLAVIQSTSPYVAKRTFSCLNTTLKSVGFSTYPYHVFVPAFGDWGYILVSKEQFHLSKNYPKELKFINFDIAESLFVFPSDMSLSSEPVNKLNNQILVRLFEEEWGAFIH
ncbi:MAG: polyamine aminopropyltransferase [Leptospiraceae bacterium]|nr:polyamine aminopropyltransferase [Leptospiraceae bacterium]